MVLCSPRCTVGTTRGRSRSADGGWEEQRVLREDRIQQRISPLIAFSLICLVIDRPCLWGSSDCSHDRRTVCVSSNRFRLLVRKNCRSGHSPGRLGVVTTAAAVYFVISACVVARVSHSFGQPTAAWPCVCPIAEACRLTFSNGFGLGIKREASDAWQAPSRGSRSRLWESG